MTQEHSGGMAIAVMREALELIAAPMRPDGTWNRDRAACQQIAARAVANFEKADGQEPLTCTWTLDDEDSGTWASSCGELWSFIDGGPAENRVSYCHHCGKKVVIAAHETKQRGAS